MSLKETKSGGNASTLRPTDELSFFNESYERFIAAASGITGKTVQVTDESHPNFGVRGTVACIECTGAQAYFQIHPNLRSGFESIHLKKVPAICVSSVQDKPDGLFAERSRVANESKRH